MSYNTRRSNNYGGGRGSLNQNFVPGGQFQTPPKPIVQMPRQQKPNYQPQNPLPPTPLKSALKNTPQQNQTYAQKTQQSALQQVHPKVEPQPQRQQQNQSQAPAKPAQTPVQAKPAAQTTTTQPKPQTQPQVQAKPQVPPQAPVQAPKPTPTPVQPTPPAEVPKEEETQMETEEIAPTSENEEGDGTDDGTANGTKKKSFWRHIKAGKISKKEKRGRRNQRLRKILQPKNALMVLNELVGGQKYTIIETPGTGNEPHDNFAACVAIDGQEYTGYGKNKNTAKSSAAENALRNLLIHKLRPSINKAQHNASQSSLDSQSDAPMTEADETKSEDKADEDDVSWLHVASYAIHKLFDSWDADGMLTEATQNFQQENLKNPAAPKNVTKRPAKQLPANAELMNPVMLLNQMRPGIMYEDFAKEGAPPAITFTIRTNCDGEEFFGKGNNKKIARKNCAYAACSKLFAIQYPNEQVTLVENNMQ